MKANTLPQSDSFDGQAVGYQAKKTNNSLAIHASANHKYGLTESQNNDSIQESNTSIASNDADYAYEQTNAFNSSSSNDISGGYKKASESVSDHCLSSNEEDILLNYMQSSKKTETADLKKSSTDGDIDANEKLDNSNLENQKFNSSSNTSANNIVETTNTNQSVVNTDHKVSERIFMTSLVKHTGIALAIIIPLAAFSAYAATPPQTIKAIAEAKAATISLDSDSIIHNSASEPTTVDSVDLDKYSGTWYEIGRLPMYFQRNCASDVTANYTEKTDGSGIIVTNKCLDKESSQIVAEGLAKPADTTGSKLKVTFLPSWIRWLPVGRADYWVLARDADYKTALVGTPDKKYLWLLARSPNMTQQTYAKYRQIAQGQGYDLKEFNLTPHANQTVTLIP